MQQHHCMLIKLHVQWAKNATVNLEFCKSIPIDLTFLLFELLELFLKSVFKVKFCNPDIGTNCWREMSTSVLHWGSNHLYRNHAKHKKCNKIIKHTKNGISGAPINKNRRWLRLQIDGGGGAARPAHGSNWKKRFIKYQLRYDTIWPVRYPRKGNKLRTPYLTHIIMVKWPYQHGLTSDRPSKLQLCWKTTNDAAHAVYQLRCGLHSPN